MDELNTINSVAPVLNTITPYGMLVGVIIFLMFLLNKREKRIDDLIKINQEQNESIKDLATEIKLIKK